MNETRNINEMMKFLSSIHEIYSVYCAVYYETTEIVVTSSTKQYEKNEGKFQIK